MKLLTERIQGLTARDLMATELCLIPQHMTVPTAARLLAVSDEQAAPVVDTDGRCVGVFSAGDYVRWVNQPPQQWPAGGPSFVSDWQLVAPAAPGDEVRFHMSRDFAAAAPSAAADELVKRLRGAAGSCVVVLDRQRRPVGVVRGMDLLGGGFPPGHATRN